MGLYYSFYYGLRWSYLGLFVSLIISFANASNHLSDNLSDHLSDTHSHSDPEIISWGLNPRTLLTWGVLEKTHKVAQALPGSDLSTQEDYFSKTLKSALTETTVSIKSLDISQFPRHHVESFTIHSNAEKYSLTLKLKWAFDLSGQELTAVCGEYDPVTEKLWVHVWRDDHGGVYIVKIPAAPAYR